MGEVMRIAMIGTRGCPASHGGVERSVEELGARLAARGHRVTVFCRPGYCRARAPGHRGMRLRYLPAIPTKHLEAASHTFLAAVAAAVGPYDVVHVHCVGPALFAWIPRLTGKTVVVTVQALDWKRRKWGRLAGGCLRLGARIGVRSSHACIAVSRSVQRYLESAYGKNVALLPNGVTPPPAPPPDRKLRWPVRPGGYLLFLGRLVPEKGVHDLIDAFRDTPVDGKLVIAGDGCFTDGYVGKLRERAGGDPRILFTGGVYGPEKEALFEGARAFVNPSELEGNPIAVLEALSHGLPVLLSDIEEHREILEGGEEDRGLGISYATGDPDELKKGIRRIWELPAGEGERRRRREFVLRRYDWGRIGRWTEAVYDGCRRGEAPPGVPSVIPGTPSHRIPGRAPR